MDWFLFLVVIQCVLFAVESKKEDGLLDNQIWLVGWLISCFFSPPSYLEVHKL